MDISNTKTIEDVQTANELPEGMETFSILALGFMSLLCPVMTKNESHDSF